MILIERHQHLDRKYPQMHSKVRLFNTLGIAWGLNRAKAKRLQAMFRQAADTIEVLSAKLQAANMEQTEGGEKT